MKKILFLLFITIILSGCEKDDICTEETTPRLILEFYDSLNPAVLKNVLDLKVKGDGASDFMVFDSTLPVDNTDRYLFNGSKLELPLRIAENNTTYHLILNSDSVNANEDILQINYTPENVFVSRACGYKTIFTLDNPNGASITDNTTTPDGLWIQPLNINIITTNITTENETHIKIYF